MKQLIQLIAGWEEMTAEQIRTVLVTPEPQRLPEDQATWRTNKLLDRLDVNVAETLVGALRSAGLNASADALTATGLDFGNPKTQGMLDKLGRDLPGTFTAEIVADLKSLGVDSRSPWQRARGDESEPTTDQIESAKQSLLAEQFGETLAQRVGAAIRLASAEDGATEQSIRDAAIAEVGA